MAEQPQHVASLAHTCELWQVPYGLLYGELQRRGLEPAFVINGVPHFDTADLEAVMCDLENAGRVKPRQATMYVPASRVKIIEATGSKRTRPPCRPTT
jgi:predicted aconitase